MEDVHRKSGTFPPLFVELDKMPELDPKFKWCAHCGVCLLISSKPFRHWQRQHPACLVHEMEDLRKKHKGIRDQDLEKLMNKRCVLQQDAWLPHPIIQNLIDWYTGKADSGRGLNDGKVSCKDLAEIKDHRALKGVKFQNALHPKKPVLVTDEFGRPKVSKLLKVKD